MILTNHPVYGLISVTRARMPMDAHGRDEPEGNLARYSKLRIYKLYVINCM